MMMGVERDDVSEQNLMERPRRLESGARA